MELKTEQVRYVWLHGYMNYDGITKNRILCDYKYELLNKESPYINQRLAFQKENWNKYWEEEYYDS